jgi:hypothetical protein
MCNDQKSHAAGHGPASAASFIIFQSLVFNLKPIFGRLGRVKSRKPIVGYLRLFTPVPAFLIPRWLFMVASGRYTLPAKIMNAYLSRFFHSKPFKVFQRHSKQFKGILMHHFFIFMRHLKKRLS